MTFFCFSRTLNVRYKLDEKQSKFIVFNEILWKWGQKVKNGTRNSAKLVLHDILIQWMCFCVVRMIFDENKNFRLFPQFLPWKNLFLCEFWCQSKQWKNKSWSSKKLVLAEILAQWICFLLVPMIFEEKTNCEVFGTFYLEKTSFW